MAGWMDEKSGGVRGCTGADHCYISKNIPNCSQAGYTCSRERCSTFQFGSEMKAGFL